MRGAHPTDSTPHRSRRGRRSLPARAPYGLRRSEQIKRNGIALADCFSEAYLEGPTVDNSRGRIPDDPEIPLLLDRVVPCHEAVKIDYYLPGCPPSADTLWAALSALLAGKTPELPYELVKYD